jgi:vancomycin resistance protein YoaR
LIGAGVALSVPACFGIDRAVSKNRVLRGVHLHTLDLSRLDRNATRIALTRLDERMRRDALPVVVGENVYRFDPKSVGWRVDVDGTLARVFGLGRSGGLSGEFRWWLSRWVSKEEAHIAFRYDEAAYERLLQSWENQSLDVPVQGGVRVERGELKAELPRPGEVIARGRAIKALREVSGSLPLRLVMPVERIAPRIDPTAVEAALKRARAIVAGPVELVSRDGHLKLTLVRPDLIEMIRTRPNLGTGVLDLYFDAATLEGKIGGLKKAIERPPQDAQFVPDQNDKIHIEPSRPGAELVAKDIAEALFVAASKPGRTGGLPVLEDAEPRITTEKAHTLGIKRLVGQFTTRYPAGQPRVKNIQRIAELLDGTVIFPGETFSVNAAVGPRTAQNGFVPAPGIEEGEMVDTLGGGISQFATTLYNAVFWAGYDIVQRQPHSYWFTRYPMGHEATLSWPKPDLVFRNDTEAGLLIRASAGKSSVLVRLYGDNGERQVSAKVSPRTDVVEPPVELLPDAEIPPEKEVVRDAGMVGWTVIVERRIRFAKDNVKEEKRKVVYKPRPKRVAVHPCRIPEGMPGHTGEDCPDPGATEGAEAEGQEGESPVVEPESQESPQSP